MFLFCVNNTKDKAELLDRLCRQVSRKAYLGVIQGPEQFFSNLFGKETGK